MSIQSSIAPYLRKTRESETLLINQTSLALQAENRKIYKFGFGQSPFPVPPHVVEAMKEASARKEYMSVQGHLPLREGIAQFHHQMEGRHWLADDLVIGSGSKILIYCIMAAFEHAEVLLPGPSWVSYEPQAELAGHRVHWLPTSFESAWKITPEQLDLWCHQQPSTGIPRILVLNYPSNPTGQTYDEQALRALAEVCKRHKLLVIADEIYGFLGFDQSHIGIESFYPDGVLTTSGLSKWGGAGGWRLGYVHVPPALNNLKSRIVGVASETFSCAASPTQVAATKAYTDLRAARYYLHTQTQALREIAQNCQRALSQAGVQVHPASGGFYLFPDFANFRSALEAKGIKTSEKLTQCLLEQTGVALLPGTAFGMPKESLTARLAFVDFDGQRALQSTGLAEVFAHSREGIDVLCSWLNRL